MVYYYRTRNQLDDFVTFISRANIFDPRSHYQEMGVVSVVDKILLGYTQVFLTNTKYKLIQIYSSHVNEVMYKTVIMELHRKRMYQIFYKHIKYFITHFKIYASK